MNGEVIVNLIVTGIIAVVPSAKDKDLIRLVAPSAHQSAHHETLDAASLAALKKMNAADCRNQLAGCRQETGSIPPHFAYLDLNEKNVVPGSRKEDFRYRDPADDSEHLVFLLRSEKIEFANAHSNTKLMHEDAASSVLEMTDVCSGCKVIDQSYFDILSHPGKSAMRMDIRGGTVSVHKSAGAQVLAPGKTLPPALVEEVKVQFKVPACGQRLLLTHKLPDAEEPETASISLVANEGQAIDVRLGNAPLHNIVHSISDDFPAAGGDHFGLFYDMYTPSPTERPKLAFKESGNVVGSRVPCLLTRTVPQDPAQ